MKHFFFALLIIAAGLSTVCYGKRSAPKKVEPVYTDTFRIEAPLDNGRTARVMAYTRSDDRLAWTVVVQENRINPWHEEDVQWCFIKSMTLAGDDLVVSMENGARYRIILATRAVEKLPIL